MRRFKYFLGKLYWRLYYQHALAHKIYNLPRPMFRNPELPKLLAEWRAWQTRYDGAEFDEKGYWIH